MNAKLKFFTFTIVLITLVSCYRSPNESVSNSDLEMIVTHFNVGLDYGSNYTTYVIADSFGLASNTEGIDDGTVNSPQIQEAIKKAIYQNMNAINYIPFTFNADSSNIPDIYIPVTFTYINVQGVNHYPIYWGGGGYGWGYPSWGYGGYPYYNSWGYGSSYYNYDKGSVMIDWVDLKNRDTNISLSGDTSYYTNVIWNMGIGGILESNVSEATRLERIQTGIDQGFYQSPYLNK